MIGSKAAGAARVSAPTPNVETPRISSEIGKGLPECGFDTD